MTELTGCNIEVELEDAEIRNATRVGLVRFDEANSRGYENKHGLGKSQQVIVHMVGARGEAAFCKAAGLVWPAHINTFMAPDVGEDIQIQTRTKDYYDLIVRPNDNELHRFVLVLGLYRRFTIVGWIRGVDAKVKKFEKAYGNRPPAWFVPQKSLRHFPMEHV